MSIVQLSKVTFIGLSADKDRLFADLQRIGCLQLINLTPDDNETAEIKSTAGAREALQFIQSYPYHRRQERDEKRFDAIEIEQKILAVRTSLHNLKDERDFLLARLQAVRPWGDFSFPSLAEMDQYRFWFYVVPHKDLSKITDVASTWEIVQQDQRFCYVVVVAKHEIEEISVPRVHLGTRSRHELEERLHDVELAIEETEAERAALTRWQDLFSRNLSRLEDHAACIKATANIYRQDLAFAVQGWSPVDKVAELQTYANTEGFYFDSQSVTPEDQPPTLMRNTSWFAAGEDLVNFYMTPSYRTWDPSSVIFLSFAVFFAMILADAGYALLLGSLLLFSWTKLGASAGGQRFRPLLVTIFIASLIFGVLVGSYFGVTPKPDSLLGSLHLMDITNANRMMIVSIGIGVFHVVLANAMAASCFTRWQERMPSIGWISLIFGAVALGVNMTLAQDSVQMLGTVLLSIGALLILLFTAPDEKPVARLLQGFVGLTKISGIMGDILSYLRLFALGLASASLSLEFNRMAMDVYHAHTGIGIVFALFILLLGHGVNLTLGLASAVIHGLRLNVIEFFNWGLSGEGRLYKPFKQLENNSWNN
jgi:V/A-type H+-transporting ATPase subunit I